ncbi:hypothetical protein M378DRAFT_8099 [Amanita muscaria Koide BX008]|uniref:Large ribosomal subunit protein uL23m n=1 Tax=Amanita muscaria (strain Koide BX008) TaxID=946122 RepID=A0A0C2X5A6_AMAMK|nr:hypothetical protein M378DRAFT_8099 [Amanita muscaria Koide BX008]
MQAFRRLYSTNLPHPALAARTASTPLAVRLRRRKRLGGTAPGETDARPSGLTPSEYTRYQRLLATGKLIKRNDDVVTELEFFERLYERRSRIRGLKTIHRDGKDVVKVLGQPIYLPNVIIRLVRNQTPPGQPYNPYEATFRVPRSVTKTDIRSYLMAVYGVQTTYIRTDNYISAIYPRIGHKRKAFKTYKRAVVGLVDPFYYPHRLEDMVEEKRQEREKWIEENYQIQQHRAIQKYELLRMTKGGSKGWNFKEPLATKRSHILRLVAERRGKREALVSGIVQQWQGQRERGEQISLQLDKKPSDSQ